MVCLGPVRIHVVDTIASAGLGTISTSRVPPGERWLIERTEYEGDKTTSGGNTRCRVYIGGHGPKFYVKEQDGPSADKLYQIANEYSIYPGEWITLEWDEAQADTILNMYIIGKRYQL